VDIGRVHQQIRFSWDLYGPTRAAADGLRVDPDVESRRRQILLETQRQFRHVSAGVGDEDALISALCHR
jgi:hypothetical protein